ncbi:receptor-like protein 40 [Aegilops tauschii subsp. strangulata]|uniref:LRR receptor-like serine/threonine-protein kinase HSL2 n=1 Tax=Aegilops tauschii TaxID=37682 RepID=M8BJF3_AEGTA
MPLFTFFSLCLHLSIAAAAGNPPLPLNSTQESIMRDLSRYVGSAGWNTTVSNPCLWRGIGCSPSDSTSFSVVTDIDLSGCSMSNPTLFASLCSLDTLQSLDLSKNYFSDLTGHFSRCPMSAGLRVLNFSSNRLAGRLGDLSGFSRLEVLDLSFNSFTGTVTTQLSVMPRLRSLNLSSNHLVGVVPVSMASSLEELVLSGSFFSDSIPSILFSHSDLTLLDLSQNNITGDLSQNNLTGDVQDEGSSYSTRLHTQHDFNSLVYQARRRSLARQGAEA